MISAERSSATRVSSRSSIRNAACSWARPRMPSASSWARSTMRSVSSLMRLAARISSGTATRNWSSRSSARAWSMITLLVSGMLRPLLISRSSCSMRKMMSIGVSPKCAPARERGASRRGRLYGLALQPAGDGGGHEAAHVAAERGDLLDQARAEIGVLERGHEEDRVHARRQLAVGVGHLQLGLEVAHRAQPAHDEPRSQASAEVDRQAVEPGHLDLAVGQATVLGERLADGCDAIVQLEHRRLLGVDQHAHDEPVEDRRRAPEDI